MERRRKTLRCIHAMLLLHSAYNYVQNSRTFSGTFSIRKEVGSDHQILVSAEIGRYSSSEKISKPYFCATHCPVLLLKLQEFNPLNAELNPTCHLLALLGGATIIVVSRLRVKGTKSTSLLSIMQRKRNWVKQTTVQSITLRILRGTSTGA